MAVRTCDVRLSAVFAALLLAGSARAETPPSAADIQFFEQKIRPVLVANCYECHSGAKPKGKLSIDTRDGIRRGGETGPAVVPGNVKESLLIQAVRHDGLEMPPDKPRLPENVVADLERWIASGAADPRDGKPVEKPSTAMTLEQAKSHWSFQPIHSPPLPDVKNAAWTRTDIDRFVLAKLEDADLQPSPPADPRTLVRRAYFDLIGLPPPYRDGREVRGRSDGRRPSLGSSTTCSRGPNMASAGRGIGSTWPAMPTRSSNRPIPSGEFPSPTPIATT